jgi:hypothetical protein
MRPDANGSESERGTWVGHRGTLRLGLLVCGFATSSCDVTVRGHMTRLRRSTLSFAFAPSIRTEARDDEESWEA